MEIKVQYPKASWRAHLGVFPAAVVCAALGLSPVRAGAAPAATDGSRQDPAAAILAAEEDPVLESLLEEVLARNPETASLAAHARAMEERPAQEKALPDPTASLTAYALPPETRTGPQRAMLTLSQRLPWRGKLPLKETAADYAAASARAGEAARRLAVLSDARALYYEIGFLDAEAAITRADRETLVHYQELAQSRYAAGVGIEQAVIKLQAEITKDYTKLLDIQRHRASVVADINALRDRPESSGIPVLDTHEPLEVKVDFEELLALAEKRRPELAAADAETARADALVKLAAKDYRPDFNVGLVYGLVENRRDAAGLAMRPEDNGTDDLGIMVGVNLPIWRGKLSSAVQEKVDTKVSSEETRRQILAHIRRSIEDLTNRLPLTWSQIRLDEDVLVLQAEESLRSAEAAYASGSMGALDLLDAERVLLDVRTATKRALADYSILRARLEEAIAGPLPPGAVQGESQR